MDFQSHPPRTSTSAKDLHVPTSFRTSHTSFNSCLKHNIPLDALLSPLFVHKGPHFFWCGLQFVTLMHISTWRWTVAAYCKAACTFIVSCLTIAALIVALAPPSRSAPCSANQSAASLPSVTNLSKRVIFTFFFFGSMRLHMLLIEPDILIANVLNVHTSAALRFFSPRCNPFEKLMLSVSLVAGAHNPLKGTQKAVMSTRLTVLCTSRPLCL